MMMNHHAVNNHQPKDIYSSSVIGWLVQLELSSNDKSCSRFLDRVLTESEMMRMTMCQHLVKAPPPTLSEEGEEVVVKAAARGILDQLFSGSRPLDVEVRLRSIFRYRLYLHYSYVYSHILIDIFIFRYRYSHMHRYLDTFRFRYI